MPAPKSRHAPHFSGEDDDILSEFLHEYEVLADGNGLTEKQKVEEITHYVPRNLRKLWVTLPGYKAFKWRHFQRELEELHPDAEEQACTRQELSCFVELSAETHIWGEKDVMKYYRNFLTLAVPLVENHILTANDFNAEFFRGFHRDDRDIIAEEIRFNVNPRHPAMEPFEMLDVLTAARQYFAPNQFHKLPPQVRHEHRGRSKSRHEDPEKLVRRLFSARHSPKPATRNLDSDSDQEDNNSPSSSDHLAYETQSVRFKEPCPGQAQSKDKDDSIALVTKLSSLFVQEPSYFVLYSQCQDCFPSIARRLPKPTLFPTGATSSSTTATVAFQAPPTPVHQSWTQRAPAPPPSPLVPNASDRAAFFF